MCKSQLTCYDDMSTYKGEVLLIDRSDLKTGQLLLDIPTEKLHYSKYEEVCSYH